LAQLLVEARQVHHHEMQAGSFGLRRQTVDGDDRLV
jgi:hypothetical protein